jgi:PAS domain S-box-containing protein
MSNLPPSPYSEYPFSKFTSILESLSEGLVLFDVSGTITYCNERFCQMTGYTKAETLGRFVYEVFYGFDLERFADKIRCMEERYAARRKGISESYELEIFRKDGSKRWLDIKAAPLRDEFGEIIGSIGVNIDITERKRMEEKILRWTQKMETLGSVTGGIAHDFNNVLTAINGYAELVLEDLAPGDRHWKALDAIAKASILGTSLTQQLLTFSRKTENEVTEYSVKELIESSLRLMRGILAARLQLSTQISDDLGLIRCDPANVQQIIINLIVNARDAMPDGGTISVRANNVRISGDSLEANSTLLRGEYVSVTVSDTGMGMQEEVLKRIFEPFFTTKKNGTGLGLSIIHGIVRELNGDIIVKSTPGTGTDIQILLPRVEAPSSAT